MKPGTALTPPLFLRAIDLQAARLLERLDQGQCPVLPMATALASWATGQGHTCLPLSVLSSLPTGLGGQDTGVWTEINTLRRQLLDSPAVGEPGTFAPLLLDADNNLFLHRFYRAEQTIAQALRTRAKEHLPLELESGPVPALLDRLFPVTDPATIDWQRAAAVLALVKPLVIISGGPGTGKTYTVARILALLTRQAAPKKLRIALVAPTGKAALRLQESIHQARTGCPEIPESVAALQAQTLHRLLGFRANRPGFRHNRTNPLHLDLLVVDEASMIDVMLMAALLEALPPSCRIILLGDRDQLASVEAGNLFGDLCGQGRIACPASLAERTALLLGIHKKSAADDIAMPKIEPDMGQCGRHIGAGSAGLGVTLSLAAEPDPLADCLVLLRISRRFVQGSGIGAVAQAVNRGEPAEVNRVLDTDWADIAFADTSGPVQPAQLRELVRSFLEPLVSADSPQAALRALGERRILCALREGPSGVEGINRLAEAHVRRVRDIAPEAGLYPGMPIIINRNDYQEGLFNGDTGVLWPDGQGMLKGWFAEENGALRSFSLARMPAWHPSYAMTVHKSQGSEFDRVVLLLPQEDAPVLSRELLYTGMTRARRHLTLCCPRELLLRTIRRQVVRYSGLSRKLRQDEPRSIAGVDMVDGLVGGET